MRWLRKSPLSERDLCNAIDEMVTGLIDADLGGHIFKQRVAPLGRGKSGSARVLIGTNLGAGNIAEIHCETKSHTH